MKEHLSLRGTFFTPEHCLLKEGPQTFLFSFGGGEKKTRERIFFFGENARILSQDVSVAFFNIVRGGTIFSAK